MTTSATPYDAFDALMVEIVEYASCSTKGVVNSADLRDQLVDSIGFQVGQKLIEKQTRLTPRFVSELDAVKYVCTEFWSSVFHKQVDTLKTNYQDMYVLFVENFVLFERFSSGSQYLTEALKYLAFPAGLLRGALSSLGLKCSVIANCEKLPSCKFTIKILR
ncbi:unnamed protein product [Dicrocoelium dendriticum]|nr:unnamed protein product [Dicrocoelium dendriticum]